MDEQGYPGSQFVQDGSDYFNLHHTPDDTLDSIDPAAIDKNVAAYLVYVWMAAISNVSDWSWPAVEQWALTLLMKSAEHHAQKSFVQRFL